jgi:sigma-B regulation protein RsbU (phosphoserine phosphatase)
MISTTLPSPCTDKFDALLRVSKALATEIHLERLLRVIADQATNVLQAERSSLFLYDRQQDELRTVIAQGIDGGDLRVSAREGLVGYVARTRQPLNLSDAYADPRFKPEVDLHTGFRTRSVLCLPVLYHNGTLIGVIQVLNKRSGEAFDEADEELLEGLCAHAAVALERGLLVESYLEQQRLQQTLRLAHQIQIEMLPAVPEEPMEHVELSAHLAPARSVSGDLYDFFRIDGYRLGFAIGDVVGKGVPAALLMARTHTLLRSLGKQGLPPARCLSHVHQTLQCQGGQFVTLFYGILDERTGRIDYCNAGHNPPCLLDRDGRARFIAKAANPPVSSLKHTNYRGGECVLGTGETLFLYTDGVIEATDLQGADFQQHRLLETLRGHPRASAASIVARLEEAVRTFTGGAPQHDDITMLALRFLG